MTRKQDSPKEQAWKEALTKVVKEENFLRPLVEQIVQQILEAEMDETLGAEKSERTPTRVGYRSGYYGRTLVTRVGKLELRVPQDRQGRFRTEVFERYQRSEKALVGALAEMYVQAFLPGKSRRSLSNCVGTSFPRPRSAGSIRDWTRI
jgi:putative transposase